MTLNEGQESLAECNCWSSGESDGRCLRRLCSWVGYGAHSYQRPVRAAEHGCRSFALLQSAFAELALERHRRFCLLASRLCRLQLSYADPDAAPCWKSSHCVLAAKNPQAAEELTRPDGTYEVLNARSNVLRPLLKIHRHLVRHQQKHQTA
jgi:hypothetical protein